ncbi:Periplasmic solute binding protein family protein [Corynebacterium ciconiae DSM 44920]|uniref:metal ABC transporter solute-binding protein, Zn/Mn family n=1 Tax=Corynebacterium ciconiae TaxID=227319 RepID=UPI00037F7630|nr:zinc ABC transporter substrate-binding protein [Corynebacterium ciconiae]WKD60485.1 Periplasmic solute binding protein family protein [Corynebacterium ciconiae DSM 44920]
MKHTKTLIGIVSAGALAFAGCSSASDSGESGSSAESSPQADSINIVTSTSIWSDVADEVVEDDTVTITPIIDGDGIDPHSFEPTASDMAKVEEADYIIVGGGGYDSWLYSALDNDEKVIHALPLTEHHHDHGDHDHDHGDHEAEHDHDHDHGDHEAEHNHDHDHGDHEAEHNHDHDHGDHEAEHDHDHDHGDHEAEHDHDHDHGDHEAEHDHSHSHAEGAADNEHSWFNPELVKQVAKDLDQRLDTDHPEVDADAGRVDKRMDSVDEQLHELPHIHFLQTHPIADQLFLHTEFHDVTPEEYRKATLNHSEPSASALAAALESVNDGEVELMVDTPETSSEYTERLRDAAKDKDIPVVEITETPAKGQNFFDFFDDIVKELKDKAAQVEN